VLNASTNHTGNVAKMGINWWQEKEKVCKKGFKQTAKNRGGGEKKQIQVLKRCKMVV